MRVRFLALAGAAVVAAALASPAAATTRSETFTAHSGKRTLIGHYGVVYDTGSGCQGMPAKRPSLLKEPNHGSLHYEKAHRVIPSHGACADAQVETEVYTLWYTPDRDFEGTDTIEMGFPGQPYHAYKNIITDGTRHLVTSDSVHGIGAIQVSRLVEDNRETNGRAVVQTQVLEHTVRQYQSLIGRRISHFAFSAAGGRGDSGQQALLGGDDPTRAMSVGSSGANVSLLNGMLGLSGGNEEPRLGVWANGALSWLKDDLTATRYNGDIATGVAGVDYRFSDYLMAGVALGYENTAIDTVFNDGSINGNGWMVTPYGALTLFQGKGVIDALVGFGKTSTDTERNNNITGSYDSDRFMAGANATYYETLDEAWLVHGKLGYLYATDKADAFTESDGTAVASNTAKLGTLRVEAGAAYSYRDVEPYLTAAYLYDTVRSNGTTGAAVQSSNDRSAVEVITGLNWYMAPNATATVEVSKEFFRENLDSTMLAAGLRLTF